LIIAVLAALAASIVFGVASVADQRSTHRVERRQALSPRIFVDLARQPLWLASIGGTLAAFALQVLALRFGPLALVQPILVCGLIVAVLISAYLRKRFDRTLLAGVVASAAGIAGFLAIARPSSGATSVGFHVVLPLAAGLACGVAGCLALARRNEDIRPVALGLACGISYGVGAFLVKLVVSAAAAGPVAMLTDWPIYALAIVGPLGFLLNENAFQQGTLIAPVMAVITATDPLISIGLAYVWLGERPASSALGIAGEVASLAVMVAGIIVIAHRAPQLTGKEGGPKPAPALVSAQVPAARSASATSAPR
jgi:drug/metabolite transporter (DMT)-like permease